MPKMPVDGKHGGEQTHHAKRSRGHAGGKQYQRERVGPAMKSEGQAGINAR